MLLSVILLALAPLQTAGQSSEVITNATVVQLAQVGLGDEAIIAKIKSSPTNFNVAVADLVDLKKQGVSGPIIAAMVEAANPAPELSVDSADPMVPHAPGVYLLRRDQAKLARIEATVTNQAKTGGMFGYLFTGGIASMSLKASISNETAQVGTSDTKPTFFFFFDQGNPGSGAWSGPGGFGASPNEFTLIRLAKKKGRREARVGSTNIAGAKVGVMDKDRIAFDFELIRPGVYRITPHDELDQGEYGFVVSVTGGGAGGALTAKIFDFKIT